VVTHRHEVGEQLTAACGPRRIGTGPARIEDVLANRRVRGRGHGLVGESRELAEELAA